MRLATLAIYGLLGGEPDPSPLVVCPGLLQTQGFIRIPTKDDGLRGWRKHAETHSQTPRLSLLDISLVPGTSGLRAEAPRIVNTACPELTFAAKPRALDTATHDRCGYSSRQGIGSKDARSEIP